MLRSYDPLLVAASLAVATLAAYAALDLSGRVARAAGTARALWLGAGALALGAGIWGMHFVGMLAFRLADAAGRLVPIAYHVPGVAASVVIAVLASAVALGVAAREAVGRAAFATAGLVMGVAIAGMHYVGVAAMRLPEPASGPRVTASITYQPVLVAVAYGIAVSASLVALVLARRTRGSGVGAATAADGPAPAPTVGPRALALPAVVMGAAIAGMHYVGMASAHFHPAVASDAGPAPVLQTSAVVATPALGVGVTVVVFLILALALVASTAGRWATDHPDADALGWGSGGPTAGSLTMDDSTIGSPGSGGPVAGRRAAIGRDSSGALTLRAKLAAASGAAGLVLLVGVLAYVGLWQYRSAAEWVDHTNTVRTTLARIPASLADAEASARGYILSGRPELLAEYRRATGASRQAIRDARALTVDNPDQQRRLATLPPLMDRRLAVLEDYVARRRAGGVAAVVSIATVGMQPGNARGLLLADSVRALVTEADQAEARLLGGRSGVLVRRGRLLTAVLLGGSLTAFALILLITQAIRRDVALREAAQRRVEAQADELAAQAEQLEQQQMRLEEQLEEAQVLSEELTETNGELEASQAAQAGALATAQREEARYRALVEAGSQIVWSTTPTGDFVDEQPGWAAFTGQPPAEYAGWGWLDAVHPDDRDATTAAWEMAVAGGPAGRFQTEHRLRRRDGVYRRMSVRAVPVHADGAAPAAGGFAAGGSAAAGTDGARANGAHTDGAHTVGVREWVGVHVDVTGERLVQAQREALIRALERSNRDLDQFAYVASHDLKAPLRGISNLSSWIEEDLAAVMTPDAREQMGLLRGRVHRMEALIDGVLQYSRAGRVKAAPERVDTAALAREVVELLAPRPGARVEVGDGLPTVTAERVPLQQVLLNLVGNALKYAGRDDAVVRVAAEPAGGPDGAPGAAGWYRFTVADNGPGIAPQYHERVFGIFQTLQSRDRVEGTGIGLSVVKKIVEGQGGRVWVESAEGEGARFHFTWPAAPSADARDGADDA